VIPWLWAYYFALKLALHYRGTMRVHFLPNLLLLVLAMPFSPKSKPLPPPWRALRAAAAVALGFALFWYDSYLPPFWYSVEFAWRNPDVLRSGFLNQFLAGFLANPAPAAAAVAALALFLYAGRRRMHATPVVLLALLLVPIQGLREPRGEIAAAVQKFYDAEKDRVVKLPKPAGRPFDVILIHICSLSWDDLAAAGVPHPRLLARTSFAFRGFNSATSYSTPAGLRVLRAPCGQVAHAALYDPWPADCGLLDQLRGAGFKTYAAVNFEPSYFEMAEDLKRMAGLDAPVSVDGLKPKLLNFDNHPVYGSGDVLERWWSLREKSGEPRAALFFNTLALHGGVHEDKPGWWKDPTMPLYVKTLEGIGADVDALADSIAASGRSAVIFIIPEHGRAIRGSSIQAEGLRDIPMPAITRVPAAVRFAGPLFAGAPTGRESAKPISYLALAQLLADVLKDPTLPSDAKRLDAEVASLPETGFLSETSEWKVFELGGAYYVFGKDKTWRPLPPEAPAPALAEAK
jgi:hypothetical protein